MNLVIAKLEREKRDALWNISKSNKYLLVEDMHPKLRKNIKRNRDKSSKYYAQLQEVINILKE